MRYLFNFFTTAWFALVLDTGANALRLTDERNAGGESNIEQAASPDALFDCHAGLAGWRDLWSRAKKDWCCQNSRLGCEYDCKQSVARAATDWSEPQRQWCCSNFHLGCKDGLIQGSTVAAVDAAATHLEHKVGLERSGDASGAAVRDAAVHGEEYLSDADGEAGSSIRVTVQGLRDALADPGLFNCHVGLHGRGVAGWSDEKIAWCCENQNIGCQQEGDTMLPQGLLADRQPVAHAERRYTEVAHGPLRGGPRGPVKGPAMVEAERGGNLEHERQNASEEEKIERRHAELNRQEAESLSRDGAKQGARRMEDRRDKREFMQQDKELSQQAVTLENHEVMKKHAGEEGLQQDAAAEQQEDERSSSDDAKGEADKVGLGPAVMQEAEAEERNSKNAGEQSSNAKVVVNQSLQEEASLQEAAFGDWQDYWDPGAAVATNVMYPGDAPPAVQLGSDYFDYFNSVDYLDFFDYFDYTDGAPPLAGDPLLGGPPEDVFHVHVQDVPPAGDMMPPAVPPLELLPADVPPPLPPAAFDVPVPAFARDAVRVHGVHQEVFDGGSAALGYGDYLDYGGPAAPPLGYFPGALPPAVGPVVPPPLAEHLEVHTIAYDYDYFEVPAAVPHRWAVPAVVPPPLADYAFSYDYWVMSAAVPAPLAVRAAVPPPLADYVFDYDYLDMPAAFPAPLAVPAAVPPPLAEHLEVHTVAYDYGDFDYLDIPAVVPPTLGVPAVVPPPLAAGVYDYDYLDVPAAVPPPLAVPAAVPSTLAGAAVAPLPLAVYASDYDYLDVPAAVPPPLALPAVVPAPLAEHLELHVYGYDYEDHVERSVHSSGDRTYIVDDVHVYGHDVSDGDINHMLEAAGTAAGTAADTAAGVAAVPPPGFVVGTVAGPALPGQLDYSVDYLSSLYSDYVESDTLIFHTYEE
eukprot:TRINITY_DN5376_c0_g1_i1.p1 TRINITY_DN5376_c0_g1~~TRINITY_DN5376_c0_g1_i1.p1  ORF type:complete len:915 (+),score=241.03 TRINITY_DN5376_c0_g1_i1:125-2869(+)